MLGHRNAQRDQAGKCRVPERVQHRIANQEQTDKRANRHADSLGKS